MESYTVREGRGQSVIVVLRILRRIIAFQAFQNS